MTILDNQVFVFILLIVIALPSIIWGVYIFKTTKKIVDLLNKKYKYNLSYSNIYFIHAKLFWNISSYPKEVQKIYKPVRKMAIILYSIGILVIISLITYLLIISN
ncbi:MAG: hypothetical protein WC533_00515 [Candidatus Pacearchaeota archaeon]